MPATSFIGELQKVLRIVQPSRIITFFFIFCFIQRVDFSKRLKSSSLESENEKLGKERVFVN